MMSTELEKAMLEIYLIVTQSHTTLILTMSSYLCGPAMPRENFYLEV